MRKHFGGVPPPSVWGYYIIALRKRKAEICAFKDGVWLRLVGELVEDDRVEAKKAMLDAYPELREMYDENDDNTQVLYFKNATATFSSFTAAPETVSF